MRVHGLKQIYLLVLCVIYERDVTYLLFYLFLFQICKIVLPQKLRYLENMLNSEVVAKAAKIRQRLDANPNLTDAEKSWPLLLAKYGQDEKNKNILPSYSYNNAYGRRMPNFK